MKGFQRGRTAAVLASVAGCSVLAAAAFSFRERILEEWCLLRIRHAPAAVKADCAEKLVAMGCLRVIPHLEALGRLKAPEALPILLAAVRDRTCDWRANALRALAQGGIERREFIPLLVELLVDGDRVVRRLAWTTLLSLDPESAAKVGPPRD